MKKDYNLFNSTLDFFRFGLRSSTMPKELVSQWADSCFVHGLYSKQQHIITELALTQNKSNKELSAFISEIIGIETTPLGSRLFLGYLSKKNRLERVIPPLAEFIETMPILPAELEELNAIVCDNDPEKNRFLTEEELLVARLKAIAYLKCYEVFELIQLELIETIKTEFQENLENFYSKYS